MPEYSRGSGIKAFYDGKRACRYPVVLLFQVSPAKMRSPEDI